MDVTYAQVRAFRLRAHHLVRKLPAGQLEQAAGACGAQNSPPGTWETAIWNRVEGCTRRQLRRALYEEKTLLQAWSIRGVPLVFPAGESGVFLAPLQARPGEEPWIYTRGIALALDVLGVDFDELLPLALDAADVLRGRGVKGKEELDRLLADAMEAGLPPEKLELWRAPSMYDRTGRQTVGGAAASFLLRPCSFAGRVAFGEREGSSPTFTAPSRWLGHEPQAAPGRAEELMRRFLRCYGPAVPEMLRDWLGASPAQARRLWSGVEAELEPVRVEGKRRWLLRADLEELGRVEAAGEEPLLLGPHDPYLDLRDRESVLSDQALRRQVWQTVSNPGAVLLGGRVAGVWRSGTTKETLELAFTLWESLSPAQRRALEERAEGYAAFRGLRLKKLEVRGA